MMINTGNKEYDLTADDPAPWPPTPRQPVEIGDSPSALDYFEDVVETSSTMAAVSAVETDQPLIGTVDSFSSVPMEPLLHMECVNKEFQRTKPKNAPMMKVTCKLLLEVHARYKKLLNRKRSRRTNQNTRCFHMTTSLSACRASGSYAQVKCSLVHVTHLYWRMQDDTLYRSAKSL